MTAYWFPKYFDIIRSMNIQTDNLDTIRNDRLELNLFWRSVRESVNDSLTTARKSGELFIYVGGVIPSPACATFISKQLGNFMLIDPAEKLLINVRDDTSNRTYLHTKWETLERLQDSTDVELILPLNFGMTGDEIDRYRETFQQAINSMMSDILSINYTGIEDADDIDWGSVKTSLIQTIFDGQPGSDAREIIRNTDLFAYQHPFFKEASENTQLIYTLFSAISGPIDAVIQAICFDTIPVTDNLKFITILCGLASMFDYNEGRRKFLIIISVNCLFINQIEKAKEAVNKLNSLDSEEINNIFIRFSENGISIPELLKKLTE